MFLLAYSSILAAVCSLGVFGVQEEYHDYAIPWLTKAGLMYFIMDFYDCKTSFRIHHMATFVLFGSLLYNPSTELATSVIRMICKMEISTVFMNASILFPKIKVLKHLFMLTFFYIRIYDFYWFFPANFHIDDEMYYAYFSALIVLFAVQLYWEGLILKKLCGDRFQGEHFLVISHIVTSVTYTFAIYSEYASGGSTKGSLAMHALLAASSFAYHNNPISVPCFLADSVAIHLLMTYRCWRFNPFLLPMEAVYSLIMLYYRTRLFSPHEDNSDAVFLSAFVTVFDYILLLWATPNGPGAALLWEYSVQLMLAALSQQMSWFNDLSYIFFHGLLIANANTFGRMFLAAGV